MYLSKWASFSAGVFLQFCSGLCYTFSLFAPAIKEKFGFTQTELEGIGTALTSGGLFAIVPGLYAPRLCSLAADVCSDKHLNRVLCRFDL